MLIFSLMSFRAPFLECMSKIFYNIMLGLPLWHMHRQLEIMRSTLLIKEMSQARYVLAEEDIFLQRHDGKKYHLISRSSDTHKLEQCLITRGSFHA